MWHFRRQLCGVCHRDRRRRDPISSRRFDDFFREAGIVIEAVTLRQAEIAREAYRDFGKGRHRAGLNFGDCFAYALAKEKGETLLFKGDDFRHTDIEAGEDLSGQFLTTPP